MNMILRGIGIFIILIGAFLGYNGLYAESSVYFRLGVTVGMGALVIGIVMTITGFRKNKE